MMVQQLIQEWPAPVMAGDTIAEAIMRFDEVPAFIQHLPVIDDEGVLVGVLEQERIQGLPDVLPIHTLLRTEPIRMEAENHIYEAAHLFRIHQQTILPVVESDGTYLGFIRQVDVFDTLAHTLATHKEGAIVIVEMPTRDYTLGQLIYIIEQNNAQILSITTDIEDTQMGMAQITLKLNVADATRVRHVLGHYGYHVVHYYDAGTTADLQQRVEEFMRYLEV